MRKGKQGFREKVTTGGNWRQTALPSDVRSWLTTVVAVFFIYLAVSHAIFFGAAWQVPLLVGATAALVSSEWRQAGIVTLILMTAMTALLPGVAYFDGVRANPFVLVMSSVAVAALFGWVGSRDLLSRRLAGRIVSVVLVCLVVVNLWTPLLYGRHPFQAYGSLAAEGLRVVPQPGQYSSDAQLYLRIFHLMHSGTSYYPAVRESWKGEFGGWHPWVNPSDSLPNGVASYRLPTLFWVWSALPSDGFAIEILYLFFATLAVGAGAWMTSEIVSVRFAPLAAAAIAAYAMGSAMSEFVTFVDLPAMAIALVGVALFVRSLAKEDERFSWAGAAALTLAALTREMLVYLIAFACLSAMWAPKGVRWRRARPWIASLAVFTVGYAAHVAAIAGQVSGKSNVSAWLQGSPMFALDAMQRFSTFINGGVWALPLLFTLGVLGAWGAKTRLGSQFSVFAAASLIVPIILMLRFGNVFAGDNGVQENYWGMLIVPLALALWPSFALLLPVGRLRAE